LAYTHFPGVLLQPLGHLSKSIVLQVAKLQQKIQLTYFLVKFYDISP